MYTLQSLFDLYKKKNNFKKENIYSITLIKLNPTPGFENFG